MKFRSTITTAMAALLPIVSMAAENKKPNIINILVDDMGYSDVGCFGGEINTPNIDALAKEGIRFSAYRTYPKCSPTRSAMLLGVETRYQKNAIGVSEVLKTNGYECYYVGKVHGYLKKHFNNLSEYGFDRSFGNQDGGNFFDHTIKQCYLDGKKWHTDKPFYKTDVQTDFALKFIESSKLEGKPFYLQLSYHAPHFPIQAKPEDIAKYKGKYNELPSVYRHQRYERLKKLGLTDPTWKLSPPVHTEKDWTSLSKEKREQYAQVMQTYAAMIDCVDQNIGRVIAKLKEMGIYENTMIIFSSDNGSTPECGKGLYPGTTKERFGKIYDENAPVGSKESHWGIGRTWANVSNTPFREFKVWCHEGGISSPLIVHFPGKIAKPGTVNHTPVFVCDLFPTWLEVSQTSFPHEHATKTLQTLSGQSLVPLLSGQEMNTKNREAYFHMSSSACYIKGDWKIVKPRDKNQKLEDIPWELYHLTADRTELNDLAVSNPEKLEEMKSSFEKYFKANNRAKSSNKSE